MTEKAPYKNEEPFREELVDAGFKEVLDGEDFEEKKERLKKLQDDPTKIVRITELAWLRKKKESEAREKITLGKRLFEELRSQYRIPVTPTLFVLGGPEEKKALYTVSERVTGEHLDKMIHEMKEKDTEVVAQELDALLSSLFAYFVDKERRQEPILWDVFKLEQYMWGRTARNPESHILLVDNDIQLVAESDEKILRPSIPLVLLDQLIGAKKAMGLRFPLAESAATSLVGDLEKEGASKENRLKELQRLLREMQATGAQ